MITLAPALVEVKPTAARVLAAAGPRPSWSFAYAPTVLEEAQAAELLNAGGPPDDDPRWDGMAGEAACLDLMEAGLAAW